MDDRWRDTYDIWKTTDPRDYGHPCDRCESDDARYWHGDGWFCGDCSEELDYLRARPADCIEDLDERCQP